MQLESIYAHLQNHLTVVAATYGSIRSECTKRRMSVSERLSLIVETLVLHCSSANAHMFLLLRLI